MKKVLIIEDEENIRGTLADILELKGYQILQAGDGYHGLLLAKNNHPDFILCDINMPGMDGYEVLKSLTEQKLLAFVPFIFLTAKSTMKELRRGMELGADDYITKPFTYETLLNTMQTCERKKQASLDHLQMIQVELDTEKTKVKDIGWINSHELRRRTSILQGILPIIKSGEMSMEAGLQLLEDSGLKMESVTMELNRIINGGGTGEELASKKVSFEINEIWVVDDDPTQTLLNRMVLKKINPGWDIKDFCEPVKALQKLETSHPELIFLDINMPLISGFDFLHEMQERKLDTEVIVLSSSVSPDDVRQSLQFPNVVSYLTKPITRQKVESLLMVK